MKDQFGVIYKSEQSHRNLFDYVGFSFQKAEYIMAMYFIYP
ncbi:MAG: hypothetical protein HYV41_02300 [Candidatus Magasanikbacteria bacterium]|nr:hypothetical protein [Candidatus Magasanikbacteria bacterium]